MRKRTRAHHLSTHLRRPTPHPTPKTRKCKQFNFRSQVVQAILRRSTTYQGHVKTRPLPKRHHQRTLQANKLCGEQQAYKNQRPMSSPFRRLRAHIPPTPRANATRSLRPFRTKLTMRRILQTSKARKTNPLPRHHSQQPPIPRKEIHTRTRRHRRRQHSRIKRQR